MTEIRRMQTGSCPTDSEISDFLVREHGSEDGFKVERTGIDTFVTGPFTDETAYRFEEELDGGEVIAPKTVALRLPR